MFKTLGEDIQVIIDRDPAARSKVEVVLLNPGFHALLFHRFTHNLWNMGLKFIARLSSTFARLITAVEIHPAAIIGRRFFIDHGAGVVIGETSEIGDDVTLYHAVTLGGIAPSINTVAQVDQKRHPTLKDGVIIGSGAQILGPITVGEEARVGSNAVVLADVAPGVTVVGIPARVVMSRSETKHGEFTPYGTPCGDIPDPVARAMEGLLDRVATLSARVEELESQLEGKSAPVSPVSLDYDDDTPSTEIPKGENP